VGYPTRGAYPINAPPSEGAGNPAFSGAFMCGALTGSAPPSIMERNVIVILAPVWLDPGHGADIWWGPGRGRGC
jgi:hypothetical protein